MGQSNFKESNKYPCHGSTLKRPKNPIMLGSSHTKAGSRIEIKQDGECKASEFSIPLLICNCNPEANPPHRGSADMRQWCKELFLLQRQPAFSQTPLCRSYIIAITYEAGLRLYCFKILRY